MLSSELCEGIPYNFSVAVEPHLNKSVRLRRQDLSCLKATKVLVDYFYSQLVREKNKVLEKNTVLHRRSSVTTFQEN